jgi:Spy/CpxP family protein refolding chaperone
VNGGAPRRGRAAALLLAVFLLGAAAGAAGLSLGERALRGPERRHGRALERQTRDLDLDAAQRREIEAILRRQRERMHPVFEESRREIRAVLRPDQQARFDALPRPGRRP